MECSSSIAFDETSSDWSVPKKLLISRPHGSLVSIGRHLVTTNINTDIEADLNTESDQALRDVHSCNKLVEDYILS